MPNHTTRPHRTEARPTGTRPTGAQRVEREARLRWVPIRDMRVSPAAQRDLNRSRVHQIAADFDPEQLGAPTVSARGEVFYLIDGQHRVAALQQIGWGDQQIQCWTYTGLSEAEEAERFLRLNDTLAVNAFAKFKVALAAGRAVECDIDRIVRAHGLRVCAERGGGAIGAVAALRRVYEQAGPAQLGRTLRIVRDAYGDPGLTAAVISGIGLLCTRYGSALDEQRAIAALGKAHGGVSGLLGKAETIRRATGGTKHPCVAAAAVELINTGRGGRKLPGWFRTDPTTLTAIHDAAS